VRASGARTRCITSRRWKKTQAQTDPEHWSVRKLYRGTVSWFKRGLRRLKRCLQNDLSLPPFYDVMRNR
jgi:hypothetical protein